MKWAGLRTVGFKVAVAENPGYIPSSSDVGRVWEEWQALFEDPASSISETYLLYTLLNST